MKISLWLVLFITLNSLLKSKTWENPLTIRNTSVLQIEFNAMIIDNTCMQLVSKPQQFDVIVLPNLYGNIVGNISAGLVGGAGLASGVNLGRNSALFEMGTRNSGRSLTGKDIANPCAMLLTSADLLEYLGKSDPPKISPLVTSNPPVVSFVVRSFTNMWVPWSGLRTQD